MRVLLVEDSARLRKTVGLALRRSGYSVDTAADGEEGLWLANSHGYDAIVLDLLLPKRSGLDIVRELRRAGSTTHILILTALDAVDDRVAGLRAGADDYLPKPFALEELIARVEALCRRAYGSKQPVLRVSDLEVDTAARTVRRATEGVELTAREYQLLEYLMRRKGEVVSRAEIEEHIYDGHVDPMSNVVDSAVCVLRKKIAVDESSAPLIHTRRGLGYILGETDGR